MPKYKLMRKVKGTMSWRTCSLRNLDGKRIWGGETTDRAAVIAHRDKMRKEFPEETYAILEI